MDTLTKKQRGDYQDAMTDIRPNPPKQKMKGFSVYVPEKLVKALDAACRELNYSRSELLIKLAESYLEVREKNRDASGTAAH